MRVKDTFYSDVMILSKLNSRLIGNLLYLRNVEKITDINNEKINSLTIRYYHNMYETLITIQKKCLNYPYFHLLYAGSWNNFLF
jgi:hypothetical protein